MRYKQAVVVIHGIGEQRPLETLRGFVDAILPEPEDSSDRKYRSKPDQMAESFELRCLQAPGSRTRPITDFYEYYWAHHMRNSKLSGVVTWLCSLLIRPIGKVPKGLRPIYFVTYAGLLLAFAILLWGLIDQTGQSLPNRLISLYKTEQLYVSAGILIVQVLISRFMLGYVADAARYLTPSPDNIEERNKIRAEGIKLLRSLHDSGRYCRIIVVGHSLGSVIGYDILRHLWVEKRKPSPPKAIKQPVAKHFDDTVHPIQTATTPITRDEIETFQQEQHKLWREHRDAGIPWLVTDFITLGSPLAHSALLLAKTPAEFLERKQELEYPSCPPMPTEQTHYLEHYTDPHLSLRIPHHGALFASTRWTNLFFPYHSLILGDVIGGALADSLGQGIKDIPVQPSRAGFLRKTLYSHVCYWEPADSEPTEHTDMTSDSLEALRSTLRLESLRSKAPWPDPD
ncbi:hypothetical protein GM415_02380 [Pseudodesulfovibrio cashew]|uniref:Uncharacterized protein n=1 Tax=Pseudodesulfovibrio cashew TaxID=2678688 RepID=A0A6I6JD10_9BACT|nr:hypothetical protein [Pseudodesulfovibrio cashew]QGY39029.1 hypothetical protein GM415_02380 [Pseudodesulfovibrio cashew]